MFIMRHHAQLAFCAIIFLGFHVLMIDVLFACYLAFTYYFEICFYEFLLTHVGHNFNFGKISINRINK